MYIKYHNPDGSLKLLGHKFSEENDCTSFPKYKKKKANLQSLLPKGIYSSKQLRSLYQTKDKRIVNADINAALNIYKKYIIKSNSKDDKVKDLMSRGITIPSRVIVAL